MQSLVYLTEFHHQGHAFINFLVSEDLNRKKKANTLESSTLFRDSSFPAVAFRYYSRIKGLPFLFFTVGAALEDLIDKEMEKQMANRGHSDEVRRDSKLTLVRHSSEKEDTSAGKGNTLKGNKSKGNTLKGNSIRAPKGFGNVQRSQSNLSLELTPISVNKGSLTEASFEVDPNKMNEEDDESVNSLALQLRCQKILVSIFRSQDKFPKDLQKIMVHIRNEVRSSLSEEDALTSVGGFIFLRLVNPSILIPSQYGLFEGVTITPSLKRQLILIAKVLQNLVSLFI